MPTTPFSDPSSVVRGRMFSERLGQIPSVESRVMEEYFTAKKKLETRWKGAPATGIRRATRVRGGVVRQNDVRLEQMGSTQAGTEIPSITQEGSDRQEVRAPIGVGIVRRHLERGPQK